MDRVSERVIRLRYPSTCRECGSELPANAEARWDPSGKTTACVMCPIVADPFAAPEPVAQSGQAGRSAQAEGDRRVSARERRIRERFPRIGGLILALSEPPQTTRAWGQGAIGERKVAERLAKPVASEAVTVLHDRRVPGSKGNIDHVVVGPAGVYVVDTKRYLDKKIERRASGTMFRPAPPRLFVGGRDQTKLVEQMDWQVSAVRGVLDDLGSAVPISVVPVLCFVDGEWDLFPDPFSIGQVHVTYPRALVKQVSRSGELDLYERRVVGHHLASRLPEA